MTDLQLAHGFAFADLYASEGLARIDACFLDHLAPELRERLLTARAAPPAA